MAVRHFRKQIDHASGSESSDEDHRDTGIVPENKQREPSGNEDSEESVDDSESDSESSDSSSSEDIPLHKPVFLKKRKLTEETIKPSSHNASSDALIRAEHFNKVYEQAKFAESTSESGSTDQHMLDQILALDDTDGVDPELEQSEWEKRQAIRLSRVREQKLKIQQDIEDQEFRKVSQLSKNTDPLFKPEIKQHKTGKDRSSQSRNENARHELHSQTTPRRLEKTELAMKQAVSIHATAQTEYDYCDES